MGTVKKIVILHGWSESTSKWEKVIGLLKKNGFEVEMPPIPGLTTPLNEVWELQNYVDWLKEVLEKEDKVVLVGHSNGGRIALSYSAAHPEKLQSLILIASAGIFHNSLPIRIKRLVFKSLAKVGKMLAPSEIARKLLYKAAGSFDYQKANPLLRKTMVNLIRTDLLSLLPTIGLPTLIIWGRNDKTTPLEDAYLLKEGLRNSKLVVIEEARHSPQFTHPEIVVEKITEFLK